MTADGGRYQIGFVNVEFKKNFLDTSMLPATFDVQVYADNGAGVIEFSPDAANFFKQVHIKVNSYEGLMFDKAENRNVQVKYKKQQILAKHFSRFCWLSPVDYIKSNNFRHRWFYVKYFYMRIMVDMITFTIGCFFHNLIVMIAEYGMQSASKIM